MISILLIVLSSMYFNSIIVGLAVALGELSITLLCFNRFRKSLSFNFIVPLLITLTFGIVIYVGSTYLNLNDISKAFLSSIIMGSILVGIRVLRVKDLKWIKQIMFK